jgi:hypothetical protein
MSDPLPQIVSALMSRTAVCTRPPADGVGLRKPIGLAEV